MESVSLQINGAGSLGVGGPNGAGKSTLFKLIMGWEEPDAGEVQLRSGVRFAIFLRNLSVLFNKLFCRSAFRTLIRAPVHRSPSAKRSSEGLGFKETDSDRPITDFSGGWRKCAWPLPNFSTKNPIYSCFGWTQPITSDLETLLWFQRYLQSTKAPVFLISHDRAFINSIVDSIVEVRDHALHVYTGP